MELSELRRSFLEAGAWERDAERFREHRVRSGKEGGSVSGFHIPDGVFVHIIPLGRLRELHDLSRITSSITIFADSWNVGGERTSRPNVDGWAATVAGPSGYNVWVQVFRSGAVEVCFRRAFVEVGQVGPTRIAGFELDEHITKIGRQAFDWLTQLDIGPPYIVFTSAVGVAGLGLVNNSHPASPIGYFDRETILSPGIVLDDLLPNSIDVLKPVLDLIWQAGGWPSGTPNINGNGQLTVRSRELG